jgi:hypothetical protein
MWQSGRDWRSAVLGLMACAFLFAGCARTPPEEQLRDTIGEAQAVIEQRNMSALEDILADDFIGPGGLDRGGARRMAQAIFLRYRDVGLTLGPLDVDVREQHATVRFTAALTGGAGMLPDSGQVYDVATGWRLDNGEWRLVNANWKPKL